METGFRGTFVIAWHQVQVNGRTTVCLSDLCTGAQVRWHGRAMRIDGMDSVLPLSNPADVQNTHQRAAIRVRQMLGSVLDASQFPDRMSEDLIPDLGPETTDRGLVVSDGHSLYEMSIVALPGSTTQLLVAQDRLPPADTDLQIVRLGLIASDLKTPELASHQDADAGIICFTPGTRLLTPHGTVAVEDLAEGDEIQTKDDGVQDIRWIGRRQMTGARMFAMPELCPVRIRAGAMSDDIPQDDLIVSPDHRLLLRGARAQSLFNTDEVLVTARDLVNDHSVSVLRGLRQVTYIHLALDRHQIIWANGMETETFHPASCDPMMLEEVQREDLYHAFPDIAQDPYTYGDHARRLLTKAEATIFRTDMGIPA